MILLLFEDQGDYFSNVPKRFVHRLPLAIAAFKNGALHDVKSIFIFFDDDGHLCTAVFIMADDLALRMLLR